MRKVRSALGGKLIGTPAMKKDVCDSIIFLPDEMIEFACSHIWFISSQEDAWAFAFRGSDIQDRSLIFLSDELLKQKKEHIYFTILHEIGHVMLNHRNSIGYEQAATEIKQQEKEADEFANQHLT